MSGTPPPKDAFQQHIYRCFRRMLPAWMMTWLGVTFTPEQGETPRYRRPKFSAEKLVPPHERAKMDYEHHLSFKHLWWDKIILSALVGAVVFAVTIYLDNQKDKSARDLEKYKLDETQRQFLLSKRLDALDRVATEMGKAATVYFEHTGKGSKKDAPEAAAKEEYRKVLEQAEKDIDKAEILFLPGFNADMERYLQVHKAIMRIGVQKCGGKYEEFMLDINRRFGETCFEAITAKGGIDEWIANDKPRMPLTFTAEVRRTKFKDDQEYLDGQYNYWKSKTGK